MRRPGIRRTSALGLAAIASAALMTLSACSSGTSTAPSAGGSSADSNAKVALTYGLWDKNQVPAVKQIIAAYEQKNPNVTVSVQLTPYADYFTKLQTTASSGQAPDVFWLNGPNFQLYANGGVLAPVSSKIDTSKYPASLVKLYNYKGTQYGIPKDFDTIGLWYNKDMFAKAGMKVPDSTWTWDTFNAAAKKLTNSATGVYGAAALLEGQEGYYNTIFQAGGYVVSPDGKTSGFSAPQGIAGLKFWTDLIKDGSSPSLQQMTDTAPYQLFEEGKVAMFWGGSWDAVEFGGNQATAKSADVAVLPMGKQRATVIHGVANVVYKKSAHADAAQQFATYLASEPAEKILGSTGTVIPAYSGTQGAWVAAHPQFALKNFLDQLPYAQPLPVSANTAKWNTLETNLLPKAWSGAEPVTQVADSLAKQMDQVLQAGSS